MNVETVPAPTSESGGAVKLGRPQPIYGLRLRAIVVGLPLILAMCVVSVYADMVAKNIQFGVLQLAPPAVAALFAIALINRGVTSLFRKEFLNRADILVIYAMLLVAVMVSTRGAVEKLIPPLAYLPYYATAENKLATDIAQHLPAWAMPFSPQAALARPHGFRVHGDDPAPPVDGQRATAFSADGAAPRHHSR
jgi:hypothetical protein